MTSDFSFRMMQGKGGKAGHIRKEGQQIHLSFRHMPPGLPCTLYRDGRVMDTQPVSPQGTLQFTCRQDGFFFLCHESNLLLWEEGENSSQNYFRAQKMLPRPETAAAPSPVSQNEQPAQMQQNHDNPHPEVPTSANESQHLKEENFPAPSDDAVTPQQANAAPEEAAAFTLSQPALLPGGKPIAPPAPVPETVGLPQETQPTPLPPILNPRSNAPSVMTLPPLRWPPALAHLQAVFHSGIPFRPFSAPGFRCVKAPSKNPALPYSIMGYQVRNGRICALLQAVPGHPLIPPRGFEGAPYRDGHFIRIHPLPAAQKSS